GLRARARRLLRDQRIVEGLNSGREFAGVTFAPAAGVELTDFAPPRHGSTVHRAEREREACHRDGGARRRRAGQPGPALFTSYHQAGSLSATLARYPPASPPHGWAAPGDDAPGGSFSTPSLVASSRLSCRRYKFAACPIRITGLAATGPRSS